MACHLRENAIDSSQCPPKEDLAIRSALDIRKTHRLSCAVSGASKGRFAGFKK